MRYEKHSSPKAAHWSKHVDLWEKNGLCSECASIFTPPLCASCALAHNKGVSASLWPHLAMMGGLFVVALVLLVGNPMRIFSLVGQRTGFSCLTYFAYSNLHALRSEAPQAR